MLEGGKGWLKSNRLYVIGQGLEEMVVMGEQQSEERERVLSVVKEASTSLPKEFIQYKVLPVLLKVFEFGPGEFFG
jgi:hypothetical protein